MNDISKETVSTLLIIAIIVTITFTWMLLEKDVRPTIVQLHSYKSQPTGSGDVKLHITTEPLPSNMPTRSGNFKMEIQDQG